MRSLLLPRYLLLSCKFESAKTKPAAVFHLMGKHNYQVISFRILLGSPSSSINGACIIEIDRRRPCQSGNGVLTIKIRFIARYVIFSDYYY